MVFLDLNNYLKFLSTALRFRRSFNALCLTNNELIPCGIGVRRQHTDKHQYDESKLPIAQLRVGDLPYRRTIILDQCSRIE